MRKYLRRVYLFFHDYKGVHNTPSWSYDILFFVIDCERPSIIEIDRVYTAESTDKLWHIEHRYLLDRPHLHFISLRTTYPRLRRLRFHLRRDESCSVISRDDVRTTREKYREVRDTTLDFEDTS
jgi:hypothetical protein